LSQPKRRAQPETVGDLTGGEFFRIAAGTFRAVNRVLGGQRWAILLASDLSETRDMIWLRPETKVLEVLQAPDLRPAPTGADEVDPLLLGGGG
jgi:hypothetical protein